MGFEQKPASQEAEENKKEVSENESLEAHEEESEFQWLEGLGVDTGKLEDVSQKMEAGESISAEDLRFLLEVQQSMSEAKKGFLIPGKMYSASEVAELGARRERYMREVNQLLSGGDLLSAEEFSRVASERSEYDALYGSKEENSERGDHRAKSGDSENNTSERARSAGKSTPRMESSGSSLERQREIAQKVARTILGVLRRF